MHPSEDRVAQAQPALQQLAAELDKRLFGQARLCREVILGLLTKGNLLIEGQPGLGKTLLVRVLAEAIDLGFSRIQFTPDLMPADITGTQVLVQDEAGRTALEFRAGPIFANIVLADEINRATPKTQSALLEAMQEHAVTVAGTRRPLPAPFVVIATQNPIEMEGTYPLPEAQVDRFLVKLEVGLPDVEVLKDIGLRTTGKDEAHTPKVMDGPTLLHLQDLVRDIAIAPQVADLAARLMMATHPESEHATAEVKQYVRYGASPRAMQALVLAGRAHALMSGRAWMSSEDLRRIAHPVLRHRMILNFSAGLDGVTSNTVVDSVLSSVRELRAVG